MLKRFKKFIKKFGPGFVTGASDDDPSGIATFSQTGALFGFGQLWVSLFSFPLMTAIQETCGRIGLVTGRGIAGIIRKHYSKPVLYFCVTLLLFANIVNIGADLGAMASSAQLILGLPFALWLIIMVLITLFLEVFVSYKTYSKVLKYFALSLLSYIVVAFIVKQDWLKILESALVPSFILSKSYVLNLVALLGTTISPYLFFWQADQEVEEEVNTNKLVMMGRGVPKVTKGDVRDMKTDTVIGMFFSQIVMFFIIITAASTLGVSNIKTVETASQAAEALRPFAGDFTFLLFALGIIGTGLLAVPVLAGSASYALAETFGWREGLYRKFKQARIFYGVIIFATLIGFLINFTPLKPFQVLYYTAVFNGLCAPPLLIMIILIGNNKKIMGKYVNSLATNILSFIVTALMIVASFVLLLSYLYE